MARVGSADSLERRANSANLSNIGFLRPPSQGVPTSIARRTTPAPAPAPAPAPVAQTFSQQIDYGQETPAIPAPAMPDVSVETLTKTPEYMARERAIQSALDLFKANQATNKTRFEEDYGRSLGELGYDPTNKNWDLGELLSSGQRATASGKAYNALRNDFAARGMLQSGAYQAQRGVVAQQLADQLQGVERGRTKFFEDQTAAETAQQQQAEQQRQQALNEARQAILERFALGG